MERVGKKVADITRGSWSCFLPAVFPWRDVGSNKLPQIHFAFLNNIVAFFLVEAHRILATEF
jgi:hypothetical protein